MFNAEPSRDVRVGIIGTGSIARDQHAPACIAASNARLHSVLSRTTENAEAFAAEFGAGKAFTDIEEFLGDPSLMW